MYVYYNDGYYNIYTYCPPEFYESVVHNVFHYFEPKDITMASFDVVFIVTIRLNSD